jgi:NAD(P)-dependent dehydrogenase (short-subunit alcohol dehydrogenase family)
MPPSPPTGRLQNKVSIVTGSSSGLGRAIALTYSREGAHLVCVDLEAGAREVIESETDANTDDLIREQGGKAVFVKADVTKGEDWERVVREAVGAFGRVDV